MVHHQITVIGPIASGKTTASHLLSEQLDLPLLDADLYEENPFLENYIKDTPRWSFTTELFFTLARIKKLRQVKSMLNKSSVIVDSGLIMSHQVYTKNHLVQGTMTAAEWEFFTRIVDDLCTSSAIAPEKCLQTRSSLGDPAPDIVIHLTCSPEIQFKRISTRGRSFESGYTLEYLQSITDRLTEYAQSLTTQKNVTYLPFDSEKFDLTQPSGVKELLSLIQSHLS